jgi:hypothetical protein
MVGAPRSPAPPLRGHAVDIFMLVVGTLKSPVAPPRGAYWRHFYIDGGHSWISVSTSQGACHRCFLALMLGAPRSPTPPPTGPVVDIFLELMVGTPESPAPPPRDPPSTFFSVDGERFWISGTAA